MQKTNFPNVLTKERQSRMGEDSKMAVRAVETGERKDRVLIVEDSENDALLLEIELQRAGYEPVCRRVDTAPAMNSALDTQGWDIIIADYLMPHFNGIEALTQVKAKGLDIPFIIVSGHIDEDTAVAAMKAGAHDYVMKDKLARLGPAVQRELREAEIRRLRRQGEERLKAEHTFREAIENSVPSGITAVDLEGHQTYVNPAFCAMVGWAEHDLVGARPREQAPMRPRRLLTGAWFSVLIALAGNVSGSEKEHAGCQRLSESTRWRSLALGRWVSRWRLSWVSWG